MCNCVESIKERLQNEYAEKNNPGMEIEDVICEAESIIFGKQKAKSQITIPFMIYHKPIGRKKKTQVFLTTKFCPFCGKPVDDVEQEGANGTD